VQTRAVVADAATAEGDIAGVGDAQNSIHVWKAYASDTGVDKDCIAAYGKQTSHTLAGIWVRQYVAAAASNGDLSPYRSTV
jgi:hypothetical protein